jgi:Domain of unknown function(DUF2779)
MKPMTLTKSRFKVALECPTKLAYCADETYFNAKQDDEFLEALADGGHKIGALAQRMYPGGIEITAPEPERQLRDTTAHLKRDQVTLFEPTVHVDNCLIRIDILVKRGLEVQLIEVKSKSFDATKQAFLGKRGAVTGDWRPYLFDVAFQCWVLRKAYPEWQITPYLMLLDSGAPSPVDGLGAMFSVGRVDRQLKVDIAPAFDIEQFMRQPLLRTYDVSREVELLLASSLGVPSGKFRFEDLIRQWSADLASGKTVPPKANAACKSCEFYCPSAAGEKRRSGWAECMQKALQLPAGTPREATVFGLYQHRAVSELLRRRIYEMADLKESDLDIVAVKDKISAGQRHWLQAREARGELADAVLEGDALREAFENWRWPLHFIDFETARPPLPYQQGFKPNQQLLFQFSHHLMQGPEHLRHQSQCLRAAPGLAPSLEVMRALKAALESDSGTIVHWWDHEKTVLLDIARQIRAGSEPDKAELLGFIRTLTGTADQPGRLADLGRLVANCAYFVGTGGSSSIKKVLQAVLRQSPYLRDRYAKPLYGTPEMPSLNFAAGWIWYREEDGSVLDPYTLLQPLTEESAVDSALSSLGDDDDGPPGFIASGGTAMVAYAILQNPTLTDNKRVQLERQLKRYCELDTLAMVMVYEHLISRVSVGATRMSG